MAESTTKPVLLTVVEACLRLRMSKSSVYREIDAGELRAHRLGPGKGVVRISEEAINEYLTARVV